MKNLRPTHVISLKRGEKTSVVRDGKDPAYPSTPTRIGTIALYGDVRVRGELYLKDGRIYCSTPTGVEAISAPRPATLDDARRIVRELYATSDWDLQMRH